MADTQLLTSQAIKASQEGRWKDGKKLNEEIVEQEQGDIGTLNRLAFCCMQLGEMNKAKKYYEQVLALERHNSIAQKYLGLIKQKLDFVPPSAKPHEDFIEEPGKTKSVALQRLADPDVLQRTAIASECEFIVKNHRVDVRTIDTHVYLGCLPDDVAFRLQKLLKTGNTYSVFIQSTTKKSCIVFIKETFRSESALSTPSFLSTANQSPALQEDVLLDEAPLDTRETGNDETESETEAEEPDERAME